MSVGRRVYIFNHIQKCAGTSLATSLLRSFDCDASAQLHMLSMIDDFRADSRRGDYQNAETIYVASHFASQTHTLFPDHEPHYMTMLREPLSRFLSAYKMAMDIGTLPENFAPADYFEGAWPNYMTLVIGDGKLEEAKRRLAEEYPFVGISEEFERSSQLLAHAFDFPAVGVTHSNRSAAAVPANALSAELTERFYRANAEDLELYEFAKQLFEERWQDASDQIKSAERPQVALDSGLDVREFLRAYAHDVGEKESFVFEQWSPDDSALTIYWGILYRTGFIPLCFRLLEKSRIEELRVVLDNLRRFHEWAPYAQPVLGRCIDYFEEACAKGPSANGTTMPVLSVDYVSFLETDRMLQHGREIRSRGDIKERLERALLED